VDGLVITAHTEQYLDAEVRTKMLEQVGGHAAAKVQTLAAEPSTSTVGSVIALSRSCCTRRLASVCIAATVAIEATLTPKEPRIKKRKRYECEPHQCHDNIHVQVCSSLAV